ncbi:hypothetical protein G9A89_020917 [Geosiphon pyriformis]|nr:hypothetical protein G9A89_020917 [Geosiphon pyriformis]
MKESKKKSLSGAAVVDSSSRKKRKGRLLKEPVKMVGVSAGGASGDLVGHVSGNTTELESVDMEEEYLIEETSFQLESEEESEVDDTKTTPKGPKRIVTKCVLGKPLGTIDFGKRSNDDDNVLDDSILLPPPLPLKSSVQISDKLHFVRKLFSGVNGFGGASTPSKFGGIIRATFTSEEAMMTAANLANDRGVVVNTDLKHPVNNCTNQAIVLKKIPVGTSLEAVHATVAEFGIIRSIKMQLVGLWQKTIIELEDQDQADFLASKWFILIGKNVVRVARADIDKQSWDARDNFRTLLYTLPIGTTAHDLWDFIGSIGGKTCFIDRNPVSYSRTCCATMCFNSEVELVNTMATTPVIKGFGLRWSRLSLASCADQSRLAKIYAKKSAPISRPLAFGGKTWASVVGAPSAPSLFDSKTCFGFIINGRPAPSVTKDLEKRLVSIEDGLVSLAKQINGLTKRLELLVPVVPQPGHRCQLPVTNPPQNSESNVTLEMDLSITDGHEFAMIMDLSTSPHVVKLENMLEDLSKSVLSLSTRFDSLKVAMCNVRGMNNPAKQSNIICWHKDMDNSISIFTETKLKDKIWPWIINKFDGVWVFTTGLDSGYLDAGVTVVMNSSLAKHVCKVSEIPGQLMSIKLLFKNKLSVSILGLYAGASSAVWFFQAGEINSIIAKAVNESSFVILGGNFNEDGSYKCASFKKCLDLGLINSLVGSPAVKMPTWENSRGVKRTIDYVFVSPNLVNAMVRRNVSGVSEHFDTNHQAVSVSLDLGGLLDMQLSSFRKQANRDRWKFNFKGADESKWISFKCATVANATMFSDEFAAFVRFSDVDAMWDVVRRIMILSANEVFKKKWFKEFDGVFTKESSRFHKLELLVSKIIRAFCVRCNVNFASLDSVKALVIQDLVDSGVESDRVCSALFGAKKSYQTSKLIESQSTKEAYIKSAIDRRMESFEVNKGHTIRSVLECPFCKVVLDHLVVDDELVLDLEQVKSKLLEYVFNGAFSGVMCSIEYEEFFGVISDLPDDKAAGLSGISNELWKHCDRSVLDMLLVFLNSCLSGESVPGPWKKAWVSMIPKPYEWKGVLTNTHPIALIETARKTYDLVGWEHLEKSLVRIKMCSKFIRFFGGIHRDCTNRVMTDFGLTSGYRVHDGLDQGEVFSPLLWRIFYDSFLCKVKRQESVYEYKLISHFVSKNGHSKSQAGFSSFFAIGAFVDNMIWVGSSQMTIQHILNVASEFFCINDISINNDKMVAIPINSRVSNSSLFISGLPISIAKKGESHRYLGIFLSTEGLLRPSLVKVHSDVRFFTNLVLREAVSDKQFLYLVLAVLHPIVSYRTQFSFIPVGVCNKWDALICKGLKLKSGLPLDFPNDTIYHPSLYGLKSFFQVQSESKIASLVSFANSGGILGRLFSHKSHDLQVLCWRPVYPLCSPVRIRVSTSNNFLADMVRLVPFGLMVECLCLKFWYGIAFVNQLCDHHGAVYDWYTFKWWKRLDPRGPVPEWFKHSVLFLNSVRSSPAQSLVLGDGGPLNILESGEFVSVCDRLLMTSANSLSVYTNGSLSNLGTVGCRAGATVFFEDIGLGLDMSVSGLMLSTLAELQAVALALKCVSSSSSICLFSDSQSALDAYRSELGLLCPDYHNQCWVEHHHIVNVIRSKKLRVSFHKVKGHFGVSENEHADMITGATFLSNWFLPPHLSEHFLTADGGIVSGNSRHFVRDIYHSICCVQWEIGSGFGVLVDSLSSEVDWPCLSLVWHPDLHMAAGSTSRFSSSVCTYFMKSLHHQLPVAVWKCLYDKRYPSVLCLYCGEVEVSDHVFSCKLLDSYVRFWKALSGFSHFSSGILRLLSSSVSDSSLSMALFKGFVFNGWFCETVSVFHNPKIAVLEIVKFSIRAKHRAYMEKKGLIPLDGSAVVSVHGLASRFSVEVVRLFGITDALGVHFGFHKSCLFFSGLGELVSVHIAA